MSDSAMVPWRGSWRRRAGLGVARLRVQATARIAPSWPTALVAAFAAFAFAGLALVTLGALASSPSPAIVSAPLAKPAPLAPAWIDVIKPIEAFSLESGDLSQAAKTYTATRHRTGGGRRDVLTLGSFGTGAPMLRLSLYRRGREPNPPAPVFADIARQAADAGLSITRIGLPDLLPTRFGAFQIADIGLRRVQDGQNTTASPACSGFRIVLDAPDLTMTGLACGGPKLAMTHERLGCLIDRLDLASGGDDRALVDFFAASELKRNSTCGGTRLGPDLLHARWLDDRPATPRKISRRP